MARSVEIEVDLGARSYTVVVEPAGFSSLGAHLDRAGVGLRLALVTDTRVGPLWAEATRGALETSGRDVLLVHTLPEGERHKTVSTWSAAVHALLAGGVDRRTTVVALGGGVVGDVAGFAAATVHRGVPLVQLPTTVLAMVDSSVGGKTGVNTPAGKNLVGAFHQPRLVFAALETLATLDPAERIAGLGEVVKTALLGDAELLARLEEGAEALRNGEPDALAPVIARCVEIKAAVVTEDEREAGRRAVLNAGHTAGHALETALGHGGIRHGEAVALGLVAEARWAVRRGFCEDGALPDRLARLVRRLGLPVRPPPVDPARLLEAALVDKKRFGDRLTLPVPVRAGTMELVNASVTDIPEIVEVLTS